MGLARFNSLVKEAANSEGKLRFESKFLIASEIAGQFYCEKNVELSRIYGRVETEEMRRGRNAHTQLLTDMARVKREELWRNLFEKPRIGAVMLLMGKYKDCIIAGQPDYVFFSRGIPLFLLEHKFSKKLGIFPNYHVQAAVYCYLLHDLGFDTRMLRYVIVVGPPEMRDSDLRKFDSKIFQHIIPRLKEKNPVKIPVQGVQAMMYPFSLKDAVEKLEWATGFWTGKRDAVPTKKSAKCAACKYKEKCTACLC